MKIQLISKEVNIAVHTLTGLMKGFPYSSHDFQDLLLGIADQVRNDDQNLIYNSTVPL